MDYAKLMSRNPTNLGTHTNRWGQVIEFYEHPINGDCDPIICVCHNLQLAEYSTFFETDDMIADHKEYEPNFRDGVLWIGDMKAKD